MVTRWIRTSFGDDSNVNLQSMFWEEIRKILLIVFQTKKLDVLTFWPCSYYNLQVISFLMMYPNPILLLGAIKSLSKHKCPIWDSSIRTNQERNTLLMWHSHQTRFDPDWNRDFYWKLWCCLIRFHLYVSELEANCSYCHHGVKTFGN